MKRFALGALVGLVALCLFATDTNAFFGRLASRTVVVNRAARVRVVNRAAVANVVVVNRGVVFNRARFLRSRVIVNNAFASNFGYFGGIAGLSYAPVAVAVPYAVQAPVVAAPVVTCPAPTVALPAVTPPVTLAAPVTTGCAATLVAPSYGVGVGFAAVPAYGYGGFGFTPGFGFVRSRTVFLHSGVGAFGFGGFGGFNRFGFGRGIGVGVGRFGVHVGGF